MPIIGVFDSGIGGMSVAEAIEKELPEHTVLFRNDVEHLPYGSKSAETLRGYVIPILQAMVDEGCEVIVIACNTVTTTLIEDLRKVITVPLIGMEPMVKTGAELTKSGTIAVCATPATLQSSRYAWLKQTYAKTVTVLEPDCSDWALMIETNNVDKEKVRSRIDEVCDKGADVIVLGCTHYHWIEEQIKEVSGERATVLQPELPVIEQLKRVLLSLAHSPDQ